MNDSPVSLERYYFKQLSVSASEDGDATAPVALLTTLNCGQHQHDPRRFVLDLTLRFFAEQASEKTPTYTGEISVEGFFAIATQSLDRQSQEILVTNGAAILYGAAREIIMNITSRGPWPPLMLNSVSFVKLGKKIVSLAHGERVEAHEEGVVAKQQTAIGN